MIALTHTNTEHWFVAAAPQHRVHDERFYKACRSDNAPPGCTDSPGDVGDWRTHARRYDRHTFEPRAKPGIGCRAQTNPYDQKKQDRFAQGPTGSDAPMPDPSEEIHAGSRTSTNPRPTSVLITLSTSLRQRS